MGQELRGIPPLGCSAIARVAYATTVSGLPLGINGYHRLIKKYTDLFYITLKLAIN